MVSYGDLSGLETPDGVYVKDSLSPPEPYLRTRYLSSPLVSTTIYTKARILLDINTGRGTN